MNLFEGLPDHNTHSKQHISGDTSQQQLACCSSAARTFFCSSANAGATTASNTKTPAYSLLLHAATDEQQHKQQRSGVVRLQADAQRVGGVQAGGVLLATCEQHTGSGDILALYRVGSSLRLFELVGHGAGTSQLQLLVEFSHKGFDGLQPSDCHLLAPGPVLLLQPRQQLHQQLQQQQLVVLLPAAEPGTQQQQQQQPEVPSTAWQLLELDLPPDALLQAVTQQFTGTLSQCNGTQQDLGLTAAGPWRLLACSVQQTGLQLLLSLPVAHDTLHSQLSQQSSVLLCLLRVAGSAWSSSAATAADDDGMSVVACGVLPWHAAPTCAAIFAPGSSNSSSSRKQQCVAVGSAGGDLALVEFSSNDGAAATGAHQWQQQPADAATSTLLASMQVPGAVQIVAHLSRAHVAGASQTDVLAVLFKQQQQQPAAGQGQHGASSSMAVWLVKQQGGELQTLATVQGVVGLSTPSGHSALGLLCPPPPLPHKQQQQQRGDLGGVADSAALQLAALIFLDHSSSSGSVGTQDSHLNCLAPATTGLEQCAWLGPGQCECLPGPLLGVLRAGRQNTGNGAGVPAAAGGGGGAAAAAAGAPTDPAAVLCSSELKGLRVMLSALERRWQQETRELCAMQHRTVISQQVAAAAHKQMCQLAADTLYRSSVRQYTLPYCATASADAALAVYQAGRQLAAQAQQQLVTSVALPHRLAAGARAMQLLLQVERISSSCRQQQLLIEVCVRPVLSCTQGSGSGPSWSGALLQPSHAELLLWHADVPALTASSSWCWDPITGQLSITATIAASLLLQMHSTSSSRSSGVNGSKAGDRQSGRSKHTASAQGSVAHAFAAAADCVAAGNSADGVGGSSMSSTSGSAYQPWEAVKLQAAVAVSACCSKQAVVQWEQQQQQQPAGQQGTLLRSDLLAPVMAVLHLQPLQVSPQDVLMHQLTGCAPGSALEPEQHPPAHTATDTGAQARVAVAAAAVGGMQTPAKEGATEHQAAHTLVASGAADVVPPTPCSLDGSEGGVGVIPDSQSDDDVQQHGAEERRQQLQQWWQSQQQQQTQQQNGPPAEPAAAPSAHAQAAAAAENAMDWQPGVADTSHKGAVDAMHLGIHSGAASTRRLLLRAPAAAGPPGDLRRLADCLQHMHCFQLVPGSSPAASSSSSSQGFQSRVLLQVVNTHNPSSTHAFQQPAASSTSKRMQAGLVELQQLGPHEVHVTLLGHSPDSLDSVEQLVVLGARQASGGHHPLSMQPSPLDPSVLGRLTAASSSLSDACLAHIQVLQQTLEQLRVAEPAGDGRVLVVVGSPGAGAAASELAECWVDCLKTQADVDLAVAQLCKASG